MLNPSQGSGSSGGGQQQGSRRLEKKKKSRKNQRKGEEKAPNDKMAFARKNHDVSCSCSPLANELVPALLQSRIHHGLPIHYLVFTVRESSLESM